MSGKNNNQNGAAPGELNTIREILMGKQLGDVELRFADLENRLEGLRQEIFSELNEVRNSAKDSNGMVKSEMGLKFSEIENLILTKIQKTEEEISNSKEDMNTELAEMFIEFGKKLMNKK
jgi:uncharacterized protein involved in exopolysaccharide biosynthesis